MLRCILIVALGVLGNPLCARSLALRQTRNSIKQAIDSHDVSKIIDSVIVREKKNRDFMFLSTILRQLPPNMASDQQFQRYVLNADDGDYSGTYVIIGIKRPLEDLMGKARLTLRYLTNRKLSPQEVQFDLERRFVNDQRQIWIRLEPHLHILAWDVTINVDGSSDHYSSMIWEKLFSK